MRFLSMSGRATMLAAMMVLAIAGTATADTFQFTAGSVNNTRTEGGPSLVLTIDRIGGSGGSRNVTYSVSGTASSGSDFTLTPASPVNFPPSGATPQTITVTFPEDLAQEATETLIIKLTGVSDGDTIGANDTATVNILDNDGPGIEINNVALTEGNSGTVVMAFTVQLSVMSSQDVMVDFATQNGTAISPSDYTATSGTLTIPAGQRFGVINVSINSNVIDEIDRDFFVNLSNAVGGNIIDSQGVGTILDDDGPTVSVDDVSVSEGNAGLVDMNFTVSLSAASPQQITVNYATTDDTAVAGSDYQFRTGMLTFAPGVTTQTVTIRAIGDTTVEPNEQFFVDLFMINKAFPGDNQGVGTINNDDVAGVSVTAAPNLQTTEAGGTATFTIALTSSPASDVTISLTSSDLTEGTVSPASLTFTPLNALVPQTVTITGVDDIIRDGDIAYTIITGDASSADPNYNGQVVTDVPVTNLDNEVDPAVTLSLAGSPMPENGGTATVTATLSLESTSNVTVNLGFTGTGTFNTDYGVDAVSIVILAGSLTGSITISAIDDLLDEPDETVIVDVTSVTNGTEATPQQVTAVITDDDTEPSVQFQVATSSGAESVTPAQLTVTLSSASGRTVTVGYSVTGGSATGGGVDYTLLSGTLTFAPGVVSQTVDIAIVDDGIDEAPETIEVTLSAPTNATLGAPSLHTYTIADDDAPPTVGFAVAASSGDEGTTPAQLTVTLSGSSGQTVTVNYAATGGTATGGGVDYTLASGTLTFTPGVTSQTIDITIVDDLIDEVNETIVVTLSGETNATLGTAAHTYTILDNDAAPSLSINDVTVFEGDSAVFTVTLAGATAQDVSVNFATANGTAVVVGDYVANSGTLLFPAGTTTQTITVVTVEDGVNEASENFFVNLSVPVNATISDAQGVGTITDDDAAPSLSIDDVTVFEGDSAVFTVTLAGATAQDVSVNFATANGTAVVVGDYVANSGTLNFPAGTTTQTITVVTVEDGVNEASENFFVNLSVPVNATISDPQGVGTITDDDAAPSLSINDVTVTEGDSAVFTVTLAGATAQDVTVNFATANGTAVVVGDYVTNSGTLLFPAGTTTQTITVVTVEDGVNEASENFFVNLSVPVNATISDPQGEGTITDDDAAPSLSIDDVTVTEGDSAVFTVTLAGSTAQDVSVNFATADGTAVVVGDYVTNSGTLNFPAGTTTQTITVVTVEDGVNEASENFFVNLSVPVNATISDPQGEGTITDDDAVPTVGFALAASSGDEATTPAQLTVTLSSASAQTVTVNYAVTGGTAAGGGTDYTLASGMLTFAPGATSQTIDIAIVDDLIDEVNETIVVTLSGETNATLGTATHTYTILDNDDAPSVSIGDASTTEGGDLSFTVTVSGSTAQVVTVDYATANGSAVAPGDYGSIGTTTLTFNPGDSQTQTIVVGTVDDSIDEAVENMFVNLTNAGNATIADNQGEGTINDNDDAPTLSISDVSVSEGDSAVFTVTLTGATSQVVSVNFATADGTAVVVDDYATNSGTLNFPAGTTSQTITVVTVEDLLNESTENFFVNLSGESNATISDAQGEGTITDDDGVPSVTLSIGGSPLAEDGGVATVTATLSAASGLDVTVNLAFSGTASVADYSASAGSIVIPAGNLTGSMTLTGTADVIDEADETIVVDIDTVSNATEFGTQQVTALITDEDGAPTVTLSLNGSPLAEDGGVATVTATLSAVSGLDVTVNLALSGTASGADYSASAGSIVIPAGSLTGSITLTSVADAIDEADETIVVDISTVTNGTESGVQQVTAVITDEDTAPTVALSLAGSPLAEDGGVATVTATLSAASGLDVTVNLALSGTASGADFTASGLSISIPAGSLTGSITLTGVDDAIDEADETIIVDIDTVVNATESGIQQVTATITDDEGEPVVTLSLAGSPLAEDGGVATVTATLSALSGLDVTVNLALSGTASGADYTASGASISIPAGSLTGTITLTGVADAIDEADETIVVDISTVVNATESGTQQVVATITDEDSAPSVTLSLTGSPLAEDGGVATVTATLGAVSGLDVTVNLAFSGTASGADYAASGASISIPAGSLTGSITLTGVADAIDEADETVVVDISSATNATETTPQQVTATITDADDAPLVTLSLTGSPLAEDGGVATVTATLSGESSFDVTVNLALGGSAILDTDFSVSGQTIVIAAGSLSGSIAITAIQDAMSEGDETVVVDIDSVINGTESLVQQVTATITDDEAVPSLSVSDATLLEGDTGSAMMQFTVTLSGPSSQDVTVNYQSAGITATAGSDYTETGATLTITAGQLSGTVDVAILGDELAEDDETFTLGLSGAVNATIDDASATGTITDDDSAPVAVGDGYTVSEDGTLTVPANGVLGNDSDADGDSLTATGATGPANGALVLNADGSFEYTPSPDFNGTDSFTYTVSDGFNTSAPATVTITVDAVNDLPQAVEDSYSVDEDAVLTVAAPGLLDNDTDADNDPLTVTLVTGPDASEATLVLNPDGSFELSPVANFNGTITFSYMANDGAGDSAATTVTVTVNAVNDAPSATDGSATTNEDTPVSTDVLPNVTDVDGDTLSVTASTDGANGSVSCTTAGVCTYTPDANFNGTDSYTYTADDGNGGTVTGTVIVTVTAVNDTPSAVADGYTTAENVALNIAAPGVLANDSDVDGDTLSAVKLSDPANGTVTLNSDGSFVYTPAPNFFGSDSFTYAANDGSVNSNEVTVSLTVTDAQNDPTLTSVAPGSICEGGPEFTLTVSGANFVSGAVVEWNGNVRTTTFVSETQLTAIIPASDIAEARTVPVTVRNPLGGGSSNVMSFSVGEDTVAPTVTAPLAIVIIQTECQAGSGGVTAASSTQLFDFLGSATAVDACSTSVEQLAPQLNGIDVDNTTFLGGGNSLITFRFVDGAGNIGTADANVRVRLYGDLNEDGSVDATDLVIMANHLVGNIPMGTAPFTAPMELVDLDRNGTLDAVDLVTTAHYLVGNISCLPYASGQ